MNTNFIHQYFMMLVYFVSYYLNKYAMYYGAIKYNNTFMKSHLLLIENEILLQLKFDRRKCNIYLFIIFMKIYFWDLRKIPSCIYIHTHKTTIFFYLQCIQCSWVQYENCTTFDVHRTKVYLQIQFSLKTINFRHKTKFTYTIRAESEIWQQHSDNVRLCSLQRQADDLIKRQ